MAILTLYAISDLAGYSGRPPSSYTEYGNASILQATIMFQTVTELQPGDQAALSDEDGELAKLGILAMADYIYLRQPYQAAIATPFMSEHIGSYSYSKAQQEVARNAAALEVAGEATGVVMYDMAVRFLAKRTRAGGVYYGSIGVFDREGKDEDQVRIHWDHKQGRYLLLGPEDFNQVDFPYGDINAPAFPGDPGI